jgi:hypothetical protein
MPNFPTTDGIHPSTPMAITLEPAVPVSQFKSISFNDGRLPVPAVNDNFGDADAVAA